MATRRPASTRTPRTSVRPVERLTVAQEFIELQRAHDQLNLFATEGLVWEHIPEPDAALIDAGAVAAFEDADERDWTGREHRIIEGDNYPALNALNAELSGQVTVIYIDPPYNTGQKKTFRYNDEWVDATARYQHSRWLSFMRRRLEISWPLLSEDGALFISIDENEGARLRALADRLFGTSAYQGTYLRKTRTGAQDRGGASFDHEYVLCLAKRPLPPAVLTDLGSSILPEKGYTNDAGTKAFRQDLPSGKFANPKPPTLIKHLVAPFRKDAIVLDYFAGSGTTGRAVAELNATDGGSRMAILITNNEGGICQEVTIPRMRAVLGRTGGELRCQRVTVGEAPQMIVDAAALENLRRRVATRSKSTQLGLIWPKGPVGEPRLPAVHLMRGGVAQSVTVSGNVDAALAAARWSWRKRADAVFIEAGTLDGSMGTWCNRLAERLAHLEDLTTLSGLALVLVDAGLAAYARLVGDHVLGASRFLAEFPFQVARAAPNDHRVILAWASGRTGGLSGPEKELSGYVDDGDPRGMWRSGDLGKAHDYKDRENALYPITDYRVGVTYFANPNQVWRFNRSCKWCGDDKEPCKGERGKSNGSSCMRHWILTDQLVLPKYDSQKLAQFKQALPSSGYARCPVSIATDGFPGTKPGDSKDVAWQLRMWAEKKVLVEHRGKRYEVPVTDLVDAREGDRVRPRLKRYAKNLRTTRASVSSLSLVAIPATDANMDARQLSTFLATLPSDCTIINAAQLDKQLEASLTDTDLTCTVLSLGSRTPSDYEASWVQSHRNRDRRIAALSSTCAGIICLREGVTRDLAGPEALPLGQFLLAGEDNLLAIVATPFQDDLSELTQAVAGHSGAVILYLFSWSDTPPKAPPGWEGATIHPLPTPILTALRANHA